ncbi:MAG: Ig domain-containing protein, partial [Pseudomonadota bacterium]
MRLGLCTTIAGGGGLSVATFQLGLTGLTDGAARPGDHGALGYTIDPDQGTETVLWGVAPDDDTYGTGAQPSDYSAADGATLWLTCTDDGQTVYLSAPIRYGAGAAPVIADGQSWSVDDTSVSLDASASGANLTWGYGATGLPDGVVINAATGAITGTPTAAASGTALITATDQYGRTVQESFTWETALRAQAVAANGLGPFSFTVGDDALEIDFTADFSAHGNTLSYVITGLPSGGIDNGDGTASGFASIAGQSGPIVCTATDEYGRETTSTASCVTQLRAPAFTAGALLDRDWTVDDDAVDLDLTGDFTAAGNTLSYAITGLPTGLNDDGDGSLSGTPTVEGQSGTVTIVGTDEYGRQAASAFSYTTAYRNQASGGPALDLSFVEGIAAPATDLVQAWSANGNTLSLVSVSPSLPGGLSLTSAAQLSGTPAAVAADDTYTLTMQDEYGRQTSDIFTLEVLSNSDTIAPTASALSAGTQDSSGDVTVTVDDLDEDSTAHWVLVAAGGSVPLSAQVVAGQDASASPAADSGSFAATMTGGPYGQSLVPNLDASFDLHVVFRDASGNNSDVYSDTGIDLDTIAPALMAVTVSNPGASTASWEAYTSENGGTIYVR